MACKRSAVRSRVAPPHSCDKKPKGHRYRGGLFVLAQSGNAALLLFGAAFGRMKGSPYDASLIEAGGCHQRCPGLDAIDEFVELG